ncbi:undecaprenyl-diphosphate phosphatase [Roseovarius amoyensis]|uniref:undecaprenyl-diphosphate phosphatase n=1 Tax=Roseovarius amoyensis TaxID=2211448 RepID=UPI000DBE0D1F|nr:undecaprenyl-diphosphate phosphatase [Roseovarius amoyensis]
MAYFEILVLAIVQGITEFLPISSSAHLALLHKFNGAAANDIALDVAVHLGSILAVILYFRADAQRACAGLVALARGNRSHPSAGLALHLVIATLPIILAGIVIIALGVEDALRDIRIIGWMMILFGILLWVVDRRAAQTLTAPQWTARQALVMGLWQAVALIPGVSRSGASITGARALGYERHDATRLSMLMSIPTTLCTGAVLAVDMTRVEALGPFLAEAAIASVFAFAAAYLALSLMMRFISRVSFTPYVIYRVILGVVLLAIAYG